MSAQPWSIDWDGNDFGGATFNLHIQSGKYPYLPKPRFDFRAFAQKDGGASQGATWGPRTFDFECVIAATSPANRATYVANVMEALVSTQEGEKPLILGWYPTLTFQARLVAQIDGELAVTGVAFPLSFIASDPWGLAAAPTNDSDPFVSGVAETVACTSETDVDVVWIIKNTSGAAAASVTIANATQGGTFVWSNSLADTYWLRINTNDWTVDVSDDSGSSWDPAQVGLTGTPPLLVPGNNSVTVTGVASGTLDWTYTAKLRG